MREAGTTNLATQLPLDRASWIISYTDIISYTAILPCRRICCLFDGAISEARHERLSLVAHALVPLVISFEAALAGGGHDGTDVVVLRGVLDDLLELTPVSRGEASAVGDSHTIVGVGLGPRNAPHWACRTSLGEELECNLDLLWAEVRVADEGVQRKVVGLAIEVFDDLLGRCREAGHASITTIEESHARIGWSRDRSQGESSTDASACSTSVVSSTVLAGRGGGASHEVDAVDPEVLVAVGILEIGADTCVVQALLGGAALHLVVSSHGVSPM